MRQKRLKQLLPQEYRRVFLFLLITGLLVAACASIGSPDGGRYDEEPPKVLACYPADKSLNNNQKKVSIQFNEYIKLEKANENVTISPPQTESPNVRADGKRVRIDLFDSLQANTTYTIDFGDAIVDNNEGNPLGLYTYSFSTGNTIDTMEVSGTVLNAADLEPIKGILVGLYRADSLWHDSMFQTRPLERVARTNGSGKFTIKGVADGQYRAFALQDMDNNFFFNQKSEVLAFSSEIFQTSSKPDMRPDTIWNDQDTVHFERIRMMPYIHYYPDNLTLLAFLEAGQQQYRKKEERLTPEKFTLYFAAPADTLPTIKGLNFDEKALLPEPTENNDSITYWIPDTLVAYQDTLQFTMTYLGTDSIGDLVPMTDTLELVPKETHAKLEKERLKKSEEWLKDFEKRLKKSKGTLTYEENPYEHTYLNVEVKPGGSIDPNQFVTITFNEPLQHLDSTKIHFYQKVDSNLVDEPFIFQRLEGQLRTYKLYAEWKPKTQYMLLTDSAAFISVFDHPSKQVKQELRVKSLDEYGTLFVNITSDEKNVIVQLLNKSDKVVAEQPVVDGHADFFYLKPGDYYMRAFVDTNDNGIWDTGSYADGQQPEDVYYCPDAMPLKANWDNTEDWNLTRLPRSEQKPKAITKQKPDKEKTVKSRNKERDEEMRRNKKKK